jgi:hypothetical protein
MLWIGRGKKEPPSRLPLAFGRPLKLLLPFQKPENK